MSVAREQAEDLVRQALCGDVADGDPRLRAALAEHPDLAEALADCRRIAGALGQLGGDAAAVRAEADAEQTPADRDRVAAALRDAQCGPHRFPGFSWGVLAALAVLGLCLWAIWPAPAEVTGPLGGGDTVRVGVAAGGALEVTVQQLPPDGEYRLRLIVAAGAPSPPPPASATRTPWTFPDEWMQFVREHRGTELGVTVRDAAGPRAEVRVPLPPSSR